MSVHKKDSVSAERAETKSKKKNGSKNLIVKYVTVLSWLPKYTQLDAVSDVVAGVSLGLTLIPQSIAYAALAGLTAQYGLYSCLIGGFVYLIFGTVKEVSIGPSSLMSLITLEYTRNMPVEFVVLFCFLGGCVELLMGMLRLGFMVDFISVPVTSSFTSATSIIIIVSQLPGLLGLRVKAHNVVGNLINVVKNIQNVRLPDFGLGLCSIAFLLFFRKLKDLDCCFAKNSKQNTFLKKMLWFLSICRNALVILITSMIAFHLEKYGQSPFILSGKIQSGLPGINFPPFSSQVGNQTYTFLDMVSHYGTGIIVLPLVSVLANVAIAKVYVTEGTVNATQEMLTLGFCNILGSFISSMPTAGAFTRSAVISASGVRTPLAGLYVGIMTLLALSFLTPYFYYIPRATLAAVLISAVIFIIDIKIIKLLWKGCRRDAISAIITFAISIIYGVEMGLLVGALFNLIFFLRPSARPRVEVTHRETQLGNKYIVLKPDVGLLYPAANYVCNSVTETIQKHNESKTAFVIDFGRVRDLDYTAIKSLELLSRNINMEKKKLWLLHVDSSLVESIDTLANIKNFLFVDEEEQISRIFHDGILMSNAEESAEKFLDKTLKNVTLQYADGDQKNADLMDKNATNIDNHAEETALMSMPSSDGK